MPKPQEKDRQQGSKQKVDASISPSMKTPNVPKEDATIYALASGAGRSGVAVIRISGKASGQICQELSGRPLPNSRMASLRRLVDPSNGEMIDQAIVIWSPAPASFTGEDVLELHSHGSPAVLAQLFDVLQGRPDTRLAEPGEFSRRAFLNNKMDLTEAEGLADLIAAETRQQARQARQQMDGALGRLYARWREILIGALAHVEAEIDFAPEEEVPDGLMMQLMPELAKLKLEIEAHLGDDRRGERLRAGLQVALVGPVNAGKSSLINKLSKRDVAIVTDIPGTTRDVLEVPLEIDGYPLTIADMAGLRETDDPVERQGVERARVRAGEADYNLALFDGATWPDVDPETMALLDDRALVVLNKTDLLNESGSLEIGGYKTIGISCHTGDGLDHLVTALADVARRSMNVGDAPLLTRARHREALIDVKTALDRLDHEVGDIELALLAENLRIAANGIGRITGRVYVDDLLDRIFGEFCIGK